MYKRLLIIAIPIMTLVYGSILSAQSQTSRDWTLYQPRIITSGGRTISANYSLDYVSIGGLLGGRATSPGYTLYANLIPGVSIYIYPLDWSLDSIKPGESVINNAIIVKNTGGIKVSYNLEVLDPSGTWSPSYDNNDSLNKYILSAVFTDIDVSEIGDADFNESGNEDIVLDYSQPSTDIRFATSSSAKNGAGVNPGEERALWLKFTAPEVDTTKKEHNIWVIVKAGPSKE